MAEDLKARLQTLAERNSEPLPGREVVSDEEAKERFLDLLGEGVMPEPAARAVGRTPTWFKRRRNPEAANYDEYFADSYAEIMAPDGFHREAVVARARAALVAAAESGNVRAIEKILMAYDPEFNFLRPVAAGDVYNVDKLMLLMGDVPTPVLQQLRAALQAQKALPDIEA